MAADGAGATAQAISPCRPARLQHTKASPRSSTLPAAARCEAGSAWIDLGLHHHQRGAYAQAEAALRQALIIDPACHIAQLTLGQIYLLRGLAEASDAHLQQARAHLRVAARLLPADGRAESLLGLLVRP